MVLAFAAWTVIYQACLVAGVEAEWAVAAELVALGPCLAVAFGGAAPEPGREPRAGAARRGAAPWWSPGSPRWWRAPGFAFFDAPWPLVIGAWLVAAGAALASAGARAGVAARRDGTVVALAWAGGLAALSLFLVNPNGDDGEYVHLSAWVAAHGSFPVRDTLFSDQVLPAIFFPPLSSFEALLGALAGTSGLPARDVVYLAVPPVAAALAVLALWRLLRTWRVPTPAIALSVALAFLLLDAAGMRSFGSFWLARLWQVVVFVAVLVPALFALLHEHAERPSRRGLLLLAAASVASVGLTTTAIFVVPVIAAGCLAPLCARHRAAPPPRSQPQLPIRSPPGRSRWPLADATRRSTPRRRSARGRWRRMCSGTGRSRSSRWWRRSRVRC